MQCCHPAALLQIYLLLLALVGNSPGGGGNLLLPVNWGGSLVRDGTLPFGHAKGLAGVSDEAEQLRLAELVLKQNLSVRNLERLVKGPRARDADIARDLRELHAARDAFAAALSPYGARTLGLYTAAGRAPT